MIPINFHHPFSDSGHFITSEDSDSPEGCRELVEEDLEYNILSSRIFLSRCVEEKGNFDPSVRHEENSLGNSLKISLVEKCWEKFVHHNFSNHINDSLFFKKEGTVFSDFTKACLKIKLLDADLSEKKQIESELLEVIGKSKKKPKETADIYERMLSKYELSLPIDSVEPKESTSTTEEMKALSKNIIRLSTLILRLTHKDCKKDVPLSQKLFQVNANANHALFYCYNLDPIS